MPSSTPQTPPRLIFLPNIYSSIFQNPPSSPSHCHHNPPLSLPWLVSVSRMTWWWVWGYSWVRKVLSLVEPWCWLEPPYIFHQDIFCRHHTNDSLPPLDYYYNNIPPVPHYYTHQSNSLLPDKYFL